jgi:hypothetical protein
MAQQEMADFLDERRVAEQVMREIRVVARSGEYADGAGRAARIAAGAADRGSGRRAG